ncbi:MAG TPA: hypothetical protein VJP85_03405 [Candidatus Baltobacteraceae bacterium]|nr:hypothetical protein [Candidatus Baltobacteraceae bacterium]
MVEPSTLRQTPRDKGNIRPRTARQATQQRVSRKARARYSSLLQFCAVLAVVLCGVMLYVMLTARLTSLNYAVAKAERQRTALQAETARLDDRLAALKSDDRLAALAARLHMQDPTQFAMVSLPARTHPPSPSRLAFFAGLAGLFGAK